MDQLLDLRLDEALRVRGWMTPKELEWLAIQAKSHKRIIELGSLYGRSTLALALNTKGVVIAVDDFYGPRNDGVNVIEFDDNDRKTILDEFFYNTCICGNIIVIQVNHRDFDPQDDYDMVFIDGSHQYEHVKSDISKFQRQKNCLISGHDINYPTVKQAVDELLPGYIVIPETTIWAYQQ